MFKSLFKKLFIYPLIFLLLMAVYTAVISIAPLIPGSMLTEQLNEAYEMLQKEDLYPTFYSNNIGFYDNWTDADTLNIIASQKPSNPLLSGVKNDMAHCGIEGSTVIDDIGAALKGEGEVWPYSNYWLGNILLIKLALLVMSWGQLRYFIYFLMFMLWLWVEYEMSRKLDRGTALAFAFTTFLMCSFMNVSNIAASSDILTTLIVLLLVFRNINTMISTDYYDILMFVSGSFLFFIGFLWAPCYTLGLIIIIAHLLFRKNGLDIKQTFRKNAEAAFFFVAGYLSTAFFKQVLAKLVIGHQVGIGKFKSWAEGGIVDRIIAISKPWKRFMELPLIPILLVLIIILISLFALCKIHLDFGNVSISEGVYLLVVSFIISAIYFMVLSRAAGHGFYVQNCASTVFVLGYLVTHWIVFDSVE